MGWTNADNKFGPTKFMVGPVLGDGVNYTSIAAAITDAGAGPADIYIRPSTYTEDLLIPANINLISCSMSGDTSVAQVIIQGTHQVPFTGLVLCRGIRFQSVTDNFTVQDSLGVIAALELIDCSLQASNRNFVVGSGAGAGQIKLVNCTLTSVGRNIEVPTGAVTGDHELRNCYLSSSGDACVYMDAPSSGVCTGSELIAGGSSDFYFDTNAATATLDVSYTKMQAPAIACITFQSAASVNSYANIFNPSGNAEYITGPGNYTYVDDQIVGGFLNSGIDNAAVQAIGGWRPWSQSTPSPGTAGVRGTSCYDNTQFTVTNGFVQLTGSSGFVWTDQAASTTVTSNSGSFATAAIALTLPAAPVQGDVCKFKTTSASVLTVTANAGQTIQLGNQISAVAGTCASTDSGDALELTYRAASTRWISNAVIGNWIVT